MTVLTDTQVVTASGGLVELGYSQITSAVTVTASSTDASPVTVIPALTVVCDGSPVLVEFFAPFWANNAAGGYLNIGITQDGTLKNRWATNYAGANTAAGQTLQLRTTPTAGVHTFAVTANVNGNPAAGSINAGTYGAGSGTSPPAFLRVSKIVQATQWPAVTTGTIICTSSTRPASPFVGQQIYETDTSLPYTYNGTIWTSSLPAFLSASGTDVTAGAFGGNIIYTFATVTLTPGTWLVTAGMGLINTTTSDGTNVGLYNRTTSTEVASSRGGTGTTQTALEASFVSRQVSMTVTANTQVCPYGTRNGGSTIKPTNSSGGTPGYIQATRISIP